MCEPVTIAAVGLGASAIGSGVGIASQIRASNYQNKVDEQNARIAGHQASMARQQGVNEAAELVGQGRDVNAAALTTMAGSNVDITTGTPSNVFAMSSVNAAQDAAAARANAEMQAYGLQSEVNQRLADIKARKQATLLGSVAGGVGLAGSLGLQGAQAYKLLK